jgi:hypothetical protein
MAWRFRRAARPISSPPFPIVGNVIYANLGKRRLNNISLGTRGVHLTFAPHGNRATVGLPGTGLSYTQYEPHEHLAGSAQQPGPWRPTREPPGRDYGWWWTAASIVIACACRAMSYG